MKKLTGSALALVLTASVSVAYGQKVKKDSVKTTNIGEVVVTALGVKKEKRSLGYAAQTVQSDEISKSGKSNAMDALAGKVSGLQITNSGGQAGSGTNVVIRGYGSITGGNQPLYVIDGVPIDDDNYNISNTTGNTDGSASGAPTANRASDINPDDIENISILKGGAATALYGIKAQNGVIMITTKKGKAGKVSIEYSTNYSVDVVNKYPPFSDKFNVGANGEFNPYTTNHWGPLANSGALYPLIDNGDGTFSPIERDINGDGVSEIITGTPIKTAKDNYKRFFRDGSTKRHNLTVSGGNESSTFLVSASYLDQSGIVPNQDFNRNSFLFNGTHKFTPKLDMDFKINYINSNGRFFNAAGISENLVYFNNNYDVVNFPYQDRLGNRTYWHGSLSHPMWTVNNTGENRNLDRFISSLGINYKISPKWSVNYRLGLDHYINSTQSFSGLGTAEFQGNDYLGRIREVRQANTTLNSDLFLRYDTNITDDIKIAAMVGNNFNQVKYDILYNQGTNFILPNLIDINNTVDKISNHNSATIRNIGFFGDLTTSYKNLFFITLTGRKDWNTKLASPDRFNPIGFFYPSVSSSLIFSDLIGIKSFYGKLKGSYATTANVPTEAYLTSTTYYKEDANYFKLPAYSLKDSKGNPTIKPEKVQMLEVGTELGFLNNKISLEVNYYEKKSTDQIIKAPVSVATGFSEILMNIGEIRNKGIEATLRLRDLVKVNDFSWSTEFNFTRNRNEVIKVGDNGLDQVRLGGGWWSRADFVARVGQPLGAIYGYDYARNANGQMIIADNGRPTIAAEKSLIGNTNPDFVLGWNTSMAYKGFKFGFTMERKQGGDVLNDYAVNLVYSGRHQLTENRFYPGVASQQATQLFSGVDSNGKVNSKAAELTKEYYTTNYGQVDKNFIEDASWWRLRNIYLGYALPSKYVEQLGIGIKGLEVTFSGRNLWLSTKYTGIDPEVNSLGAGGNGIIGLDANSVPNTKSFDFGVKMKF